MVLFGLEKNLKKGRRKKTRKKINKSYSNFNTIMRVIKELTNYKIAQVKINITNYIFTASTPSLVSI